MCDVCIQGEHKQKFIRTKVKRTTTPFELVHADKAEAIGYSIKRFRCDNERGEYDSKLQNAISKERNFIRTMSSLCTPPHHTNVVAERMVTLITKMARAMPIDSQAPVHFWGEAVLSSLPPSAHSE